MMSGFLEVTDPRSRDPFARVELRPSLGSLVDSFAGTPFAETTAALMAIRTLVPDELMKQRISRELENRRHPMPDWLTGLDRSQAEPVVWFLTHVLGDGDDYLIGVTLTTGHSLSALVYVDHNLGSVVKDAFIVPETLEDLALKVGTTIDDPDQNLTRTDPATARAVIETAIEDGARLYPPLTSDSWPMCWPMVEWMLRQLPACGMAPDRKEWSEKETSTIASDFFGSRFGAPSTTRIPAVSWRACSGSAPTTRPVTRCAGVPSRLRCCCATGSRGRWLLSRSTSRSCPTSSEASSATATTCKVSGLR